jgi:hypothetical protein
MELKALLDLLPGVHPNGSPITSSAAGMSHPSEVPGFVEPSLLCDDESELKAARVIIVSAPGAVGKSTLARAIASRCSLPLWDLAKAGPVGQSSVFGAISVSLGANAFPSFLAGIAAGTNGLAIDALDEARVKVTAQAFNAFLADVATLANTSTSCTFVLFGRTQIAESAWLELQLGNVPCSLVSIDWFDGVQAREYVERRIAVSGTAAAGALTTHRVPFELAREALFGLLSESITGDKSAESFLGYAPVLDAMAVRLSESANFEATRTSILKLSQGEVSGQAQSPARLLRQVCIDILEREQREKVRAAIRPPLLAVAQKAGWTDWDSLYSTDEQCDRVVARLLGAAYESTLPLPAEVRVVYEEQLSTFLGEHPFLANGNKAANAVFETFLLARALLGGKDQKLREAAEARFIGGFAPATRLLSDFYFLFMKDRGGSLIPIGHVSPIYRSLLAAQSEHVHVALSIECAEPEAPETLAFAEVEFLVCVHPDDDGDTSLPTTHEFAAAVNPDSVIPISSYIVDAFIDVPCAVRLTATSGEFEFGPSVGIYCRELSFATGGVVVGASRHSGLASASSDSAVILRASSCDCSSVLRVTARSPLQVAWPGSKVFPWTEFSQDDIPAAFMEDERVEETYKRFRRIVLTLRSHSKGSLARYYKKVEHQRVLKGAVGEVLLRYMLRDGILARHDDFYHWEPDAAARHVGVSWTDLRRGVPGERLGKYLQAFVDRNAGLFE